MNILKEETIKTNGKIKIVEMKYENEDKVWKTKITKTSYIVGIIKSYGTYWVAEKKELEKAEELFNILEDMRKSVA